ncbi:hypothetical protein BTR14_13145 [Rhizobium rhizosphaerae]|uniref:Terminase n=1 Tax=Xaviernesmea rhizosphaerae TaxID=1672749 RepID=A0ABX3PC89_9HYPH|nr:hypothetical protein [Xaviernesmea rhizosphaerae]OQP86023.1 hypothetical protein BTR14_13145 [Xaviernesmea rhizosphaerae]
MNILQACDHPDLFRPWFKNRESFVAWFAFLAALFGLPMTDEQFAIYQKHTGRQERPTQPSDEAWLIIGRRGGKSFTAALVAVYLACFYDYQQFLAPGERGTVLIIAADKKQARSILRYIAAMLNNIPMLKAMIERETADSFDLDNSVTIEVGVASFRSTRGYTYVAVLADEIAFWRTDDAAEPDYAILDAIRPGMATIPNAMLLCMSSPYARRGALWDAFRRYFGKDGEPLVWKAATREMNPSVRQSVIDRATERDPNSAAAEYGAEFRSDIESYISREAVEGCVEPGVIEKLPLGGIFYRAFVDPSGGTSDSMTMAIAHTEQSRAVLDLVREIKAPFSPEAAVKEFCDLLKLYRVSKVVGDRYAGEWPREQFRKHGISYEPAAKPKSDLYRDMLPVINSRECELLDIPVLVNQICGLERRTARGGRDSIDHSPGAHDDVANAVAGAIAITKTSGFTLENI